MLRTLLGVAVILALPARLAAQAPVARGIHAAALAQAAHPSAKHRRGTVVRTEDQDHGAKAEDQDRDDRGRNPNAATPAQRATPAVPAHGEGPATPAKPAVPATPGHPANGHKP